MSDNSGWAVGGNQWSSNNKDDWTKDLPEDSEWEAKDWSQNSDSPQRKACFVCDDDDSQVECIELACGEHALCVDCLRHAATSAVGDESVYPISCADPPYCPPVPDWEIERILSAGSDSHRLLLERYQAKVEEYSTPAAFRTYCASKDCQSAQGQTRFLDAQIVGDDTAVICPDCSCVTCRRCKELVVPGQAHVCNTDKHDAFIRAFVKSLPQNQQWLWQKCPHCNTWVEKTEACNHMTCRCGGEFCLVCGRKWTGLASCVHGCPKYQRPEYDSEDYNQHGFHRDTGLDRDGNPANPNLEHEQDDGYGDDYEDNEYGNDYEISVYGEDGFDQWDRDNMGYDRQGLDSQGYSREGYDIEGYGRDGYNAAGYDRDGLDNKLMDPELYFDDGYDSDGFDRDEVSMMNWPREYYDSEGYDPFGFDVFGYSRSGLDFESRDIEGYSVEGYDAQGFDRSGYDAPAPFGYSETGTDRRGRDREGYSAYSYSAHHISRTGAVEPGYHTAPDGNQLLTRYEEGPSAQVMDCEHQAGFVRGSSTCYICQWTSDIFYQRCRLCGEHLCRACNGMSHESQQQSMRWQYLWPGSDSYGIREMFEGAEAVIRFAEEHGFKKLSKRVLVIMAFVEELKKRPVAVRRHSFSVLNSEAWAARAEMTKENHVLE